MLHDLVRFIDFCIALSYCRFIEGFHLCSVDQGRVLLAGVMRIELGVYVAVVFMCALFIL